MNFTTTTLLFVGAAFLAACISGETRTPPSEPPAPSAPAAENRVDVGTVGTLLQEMGATTALRDEPAVRAYQRLAEAFASGQEMRVPLRLYELMGVVPDEQAERARASALGLGELHQPNGPALVSLSPRLWFESRSKPGYVFHVDRQTGFEAMIDQSRFHRLPGEKETLGDEPYINGARRFMDGVRRHRDVAVYPYRVVRFMNAVSEGVGAEPEVTVSQITVSFNTHIDDLPVIGSGSRFNVYMSIAGEVIGYSDSLRPWQATPVTEYQLADLVPPDEALQQTKAALSARGVDLADFDLVRQEFGYLRGSRYQHQTLVVPHYVFVFEPDAKTVAKRLVETIPAVRDPEVVRVAIAEMQPEMDIEATDTKRPMDP